MSFKPWVTFSSLDEMIAWIFADEACEGKVFLSELKTDFFSHIDLTKIHPRYEFIAFYRDRSAMNHVELMGYISYEKAWELEGVIEQKFLFCSSPLTFKTYKTLNDDLICFLPIIGSEEEEDPERYEMDYETFYEYMKFLRGEAESVDLRTKSPLLMGSLLSLHFDTVEERVEFETFRTEKERHFLFDFLMKDMSEASVISSLEFNGFSRWLDENMILENLKDQVNWWLRTKDKTLPLPTKFFKVPFEDIGDELPYTELLTGGYAHIAYNELVYWVQSCSLNRHHQFVLQNAYFSEKDPGLLQERDRMSLFLKTLKRNKKPIAAVRSSAVSSAQLSIEIEDLGHVMPPCMKAVLDDPSFPKHETRLRWTQVCAKAGIPKEIIESVLETKHDLKTPMNQRFNVAYTYSRMPEHVHNCKNIIKDTQNKIADCLKCGFIKEKDPIEACKQHHGMKFLTYPHNVIVYNTQYKPKKKRLQSE